MSDTHMDIISQMITMARVPMPPSSNNQYATIIRHGRPYHVPSAKLKVFQKEMARYGIEHSSMLPFYRDKVQYWLNDEKFLEVRVVFFFKKSQLFTLKDKPKKLDVSNRLKALHDMLSQLLGVDDSLFFKIAAEKTISDNGSEYCYIEISPVGKKMSTVRFC